MLNSNLSELYADDNIAVLTIDNGPKNLLTEPEFIDRKTLLDWLDKHQQVGGLVITGKGKHFSHGADVSLFGASDEKALSHKLEAGRELLRTIEELPIITAAKMMNRRPDTSILLASSFRSSPLRLATNADMDTFMAKNMDSPMNFG